ncbi:hypothetical protein AG1IA_10436 [Rhizoctonia solani AG-1 IA]|uniref:Uncharacterized protein n=1 Tax=Thanatephorus cucumeris (strain AG1-IA) TaxID=983506 RepID=L8WGK5_THACA|nr:hypothetical protein AG1IA_10436 [Rhizoctonia solani AG-1 IA]
MRIFRTFGVHRGRLNNWGVGGVQKIHRQS